MRRGDVSVYPDAGRLARAVVEEFAALATEAVERRGRFLVLLTGGGSPVESYRLMGSDPAARAVPWERVHLCWGDERCVPPAHPRSNYAMAERLMIRHLPIPAANVHRVRGELGAAEAAGAYERELRALDGGWPPRFDLVHLGVGGDGHVASLFPFDLPRLREHGARVMAALRLPEGEWRVTVSRGILNAARRVRVLLPDGAKAGIARRAIEGPLDPHRLPVQLVAPEAGALRWALTRESARDLSAGADPAR